ncbi:MAG: DUF1214 domain-containing protein [Gammaproteobacteria bacterium]|nr:DUF1214 domain-containing protein [Gammaproteobacteria bacterium]
MSTNWNDLWDQLCEQLRVTGQDILRAAPPDELTQAEGLRYLSRLFRYAVGRQLDPHLPMRPELTCERVRIGGDNPDYRYVGAPLDGRLSYRLRGRINDADRIAFGTYSGGLGTSEGLRCSGSLDSSSMTLSDDGAFDIMLSSEPQNGTWLPMSPNTNTLTIRETLLRSGTARPADYDIECLTPAADPTFMDAKAIRQGFDRSLQFVSGTVRQFLGWTETFRKRPNEILPLPPELLAAAQGDKLTAYFNGYYELRSDQALVVSFTPPHCDYWNLQACNHWLESIDPLRAPAHYNSGTAALRRDGSVVVVIAASDPGVPNWIDTADHLQGGIAMRIVGASLGERVDPPLCRLVPLDDVAAAFPAKSP